MAYNPVHHLKRKREVDEEYNSDDGEIPDFIGGVVGIDDYELEYEYAEEPSKFGSQVLPVADLPDDFSGDPMDGMQYLFTVRRDAINLPIVTRVENPFEDRIALPKPQIKPPSVGGIHVPSEEWKYKFEERFMSMRQNLRAAVDIVPMFNQSCPGTKDRDGWWKFINGRAKPGAVSLMPKPSVPSKNPSTSPIASSPLPKLDDGCPEDEASSSDDGLEDDNDNGIVVQMAGIIERTPANTSVSVAKVQRTEKKTSTGPPPANAKPVPNEFRPPPTSLIVHMDDRTTFHILMFFGHWIQLRLDALEAFSERQDSPAVLAPPILTENDSSWILSLLARLEDSLSSQQISTLRTLARGCMTLLKWSIGGDKAERMKGDQDSGEIRCWMVVAAISRGWGQFDLWEDAVLLFRRT